uniref:Regulatory protein zeste n=1 Tax=Zeugodacus cucurbitae TaxID=28588 RepID=A0A0A1WXJ2_ZEUCU
MENSLRQNCQNRANVYFIRQFNRIQKNLRKLLFESRIELRMEKTIKKKTNQKQFELMVKLLEKNPQLAKGMTPFGSTKQTRIDLWEDIAAELNNIGPPLRRGSEWNKVKILCLKLCV